MLTNITITIGYRRWITHTRSPPPFFVSHECSGVGYGVSDLAMHLVHSIGAHELNAHDARGQSGEQRLIAHYHAELVHYAAMGGRSEKVASYTLQNLSDDFEYALLDYAFIVFGGFWSSAVSPERFAANADNMNVCLPNRDIHSAMYVSPLPSH